MGRSKTGVELRSVGRISKSMVEAIVRPAKGSRATLWDTEIKGFGVRVTSSGRRTYVLRYRMGGRKAPQRSVTIGQHGSPWTADKARRRAFELLASVRSGIDPLSERQSAEEQAVVGVEQRAKRMFDKLSERWMNAHVRGKLRSEADIEGVLKRDLKTAFAGMTIDDVTKEMVGEALETIGKRSQSAANKAHKWLRQMCNWLVEKGVIERSPLDRTKRPFKEPSRVRQLSLLELVVVWVASGRLSPPVRDFYRTLILLGQRLREVSNVPWDEIDLEVAEWLIPPERTKNKLPNLVPLSEQACAILQCRRDDGDQLAKPVFTTNGMVGLAGFTKMKEALDLAVAEVLVANPFASGMLNGKLEDWVIHDLRRSLASGCQGMKTPVEVTEAVLHHVSARQEGVRGTYHLYEYFEEKAEVLARWGSLIEEGLKLWDLGDFEGIVALDPGDKAKRLRREQRKRAKFAGRRMGME